MSVNKVKDWTIMTVVTVVFIGIVVALVNKLLQTGLALEPGDPLFSAQNTLVGVIALILFLAVPSGLKLLGIMFDEI